MLKRAGLAVVGLLCLLTVLPAAAPVQLSYVYSGSMEPTIGQFDGYVLVPANDVEVDDVITFWSSEQDSYVTHRVVGQSDRGFITKGDANPSTDQAAGDPYVRPSDIQGRVLSVGGDLFVIPGFGHGVRFVHAHGTHIAGLLGTVLLASLLRNGAATRPSRSVPRVGDILWPVFVIAVVSAIGLQFLGGHTEEFTYVVTETDGPNRITVGETTTESVVIKRSAVPLTEYVVAADGMTITSQTRNASALAVSLRIPPPTRTGVVRGELHVNPYIAVLPPELIRYLHGVHPLLAASAVVGTVMLPITVAMCLLFDGKRPLRSVESRWIRALKRRWREL